MICIFSLKKLHVYDNKYRSVYMFVLCYRWGTSARKDLTLNAVFSILSDKRHGKDWVSAITDNVASRFLADVQENKRK